MKMDHHGNHNQSRSEGMHSRTKRKRARRWDAIVVGLGFSIAFILILTKVAQVTPCEVVNYFNIDTNTCSLIGNADTSEVQQASQHGPGFDIIAQFVLLAQELFERIAGNLQQFLQNSGL